MLDRKVNEFQMAFKKFITRLLILAAIVVFGAIAIAQAPKGDSGEATEMVPQQFAGTGNPMPLANDDSQVSPVSYEHEADEGAAEQNAFNDMTPLESPSPQTTILNDASPIGSEDVVIDTDVQPADSIETAESGYDELALPTPTSSGDELDYAEGYDSSYDDAPELLEEETTIGEARENPYRSGPAAEEADSYADASPGGTSDEFYDNQTYDQDVAVPDTEQYADDTDLGPVDSEYADETDVGLPPAQLEAEQPLGNESSLSIQDGAGSELDYQDPPQYDNTLRKRSQQGNRVADAYDRANEFGRTEQINDNPLPRKYEIARSNNRSTGGGQPGPQNLEGPQTPSLTVEKIAPNEIQVGKPTQFQIKVRNVGQVPADNVVIRDIVPEKTRFISSSPESNGASEYELLWEVGTINPGDETVVIVELEPIEEGQVGSIATVSFEASATARARSTKPSLEIEHTAPRKVLVGEPVKFAIKLSNPGSGTATHVVLDEDVPQGLSHSSGPKLEYEVGTILPGQTRHLELTLTASQPGPVTNVLLARGDAGLIAKDTIELEVVAPDLQVKIDGPSRRYLEREATFTVAVANPGTAMAKNVELVAQVPRGLKFLSTNNQGHYDQSRRAVIWNLEQLPAGEMGKAQFKAVPVEMGEFEIRAEARADRNLAANQNHQVRVEGIAALYFGVADKVDPVEVGEDTTYVINVENQGSKTATNIRFRAQIPAGMQPIDGRGATRATVNGQIVDFDPIVKLPPKAKTSFEIVVRGTQAGDQKLRVQMVSDEIQSAVIKEESTRVYSD